MGTPALPRGPGLDVHAGSQTHYMPFILLLPLCRAHTQHIQGIPQVLGSLPLAETQPICIYSMAVSGKSGCALPRHNFPARKRVCSETSDVL